MKIITNILFALFVAFVSVDVYAADDVCSVGAVPHCCWKAETPNNCDSCPESASCYINIPFEIGAGATFGGDNADEDGIVYKKMYYKQQECNDGIVFVYDNDTNPGYHLCTKYVYPNGEQLPTRTGYTFGGWKLCNTCGNDTCETIDNDTDLQPIWGANNNLCTKIVAVWCNDNGNEVPDGSGKCVCAQGYHSVGGSCVSCEFGMTTDGPGEECHYVFKYGSSGGTWKWPDSIDIENVGFNDAAFTH